MVFIMVLLLIRSGFSKTTVPENLFDSREYARQLSQGGPSVVHTSACGCERSLTAWFDGHRSNMEMIAFTATTTDAPTVAFTQAVMNHVKQQLTSQFNSTDIDSCDCDAPDNIVSRADTRAPCSLMCLRRRALPNNFRTVHPRSC
jgi:hypothetical protein